jgi:signal transduction histidine kinase/CheY-like chemotaxis protein
MAHCPAYQGPICSLCCCLDARCDDACKPHARFAHQWESAMKKLLPASMWPYMTSGLGHYLMLMLVTMLFVGALLGLLYAHEQNALGAAGAALLPALRLAYLKIFAALLLVSGIVAWWLVLTGASRRVAQEESNRQTSLLQREIELHGRTDAALQQARKVAEAANQAKSRYIAGISHEIRTPLNSILGYAQLLDNDPTIPVHRQGAIRVIRGSGEHLLSLIEGTLDIARIEGGKFSFDIRELDFHEFIGQLVRMFEQQAAAKGLAFHYEPAGELPPVVRADRRRLGQILINILGNAVKFTQHGAVTFRVRHARDLVTFEIADTGAGILPDEMERIFEPFSRGSASLGAGAAPGTGLGLPISKMLTQMMGGELTLDSTPGAGSTFRILVRVPRVHGATPAATREPARTGYAGPRRRILVVDNEAVDRELLVNILAPLGFETAQAQSGQECLALYPVFGPDLILMDLAMPGIDGWEASRIIHHEHRSTVPILIVSANAYDKALDNPAGIAAEDFIVKPVNVAELLERIGRRLQLEWLTQASLQQAPPPQAPPPAPAPMRWPPAAQLDALRGQVASGYVRGIRAELDAIAAAGPDYDAFVTAMRGHAARFDLEAISRFLEQGDHHVQQTT